MKNKIISIIILTTACFLFSCNSNKESEKKETPKAIETCSVTFEKPMKNITLPGELKAFYEVDIYAMVNALVKNVLVDRGSVVRKGESLVLLAAPELEAQLSQAYSKMVSADAVFKASDANYKRLLETSKTPGTVSANDLDLAHSKMLSDSSDADAAKAYYQSINALKDYLNVVAPFDGVITERNISPGALVGPSSKNKDVPMFKLKEENKLRLAVAIPEIYSGSLPEHQEIKFKVKAYPDEEFTALLARKASSITSDIRSELIEFDVDNPNKRLKSGMYAEITLNLERKDSTMFVPKTAVVSSTERTYVIRVNNGVAEWVDVRKGNTVGNNIEIWGDIKATDVLVTNASEQIRNGQKL
jgi:membrane fusion protein, multidrug efflux system